MQVEVKRLTGFRFQHLAKAGLHKLCSTGFLQNLAGLVLSGSVAGGQRGGCGCSGTADSADAGRPAAIHFLDPSAYYEVHERAGNVLEGHGNVFLCLHDRDAAPCTGGLPFIKLATVTNVALQPQTSVLHLLKRLARFHAFSGNSNGAVIPPFVRQGSHALSCASHQLKVEASFDG